MISPKPTVLGGGSFPELSGVGNGVLCYLVEDCGEAIEDAVPEYITYEGWPNFIDDKPSWGIPYGIPGNTLRVLHWECRWAWQIRVTTYKMYVIIDNIEHYFILTIFKDYGNLFVNTLTQRNTLHLRVSITWVI